MFLEHLLITILLCLSFVPLLAVGGRMIVSHRVVTASLIGIWVVFPIGVIVTGLFNRYPVSLAEPETFRPIAVESHGYVGSDTCRSCHPHEHDTWHASYHHSMTQVATPDTVIAPLDRGKSASHGVRFRLTSQGEEIWAEMEQPRGGSNVGEWLRTSRRIAMTTGSHHMQVLWYPYSVDNRLLGMFPFVYLKEQRRWIPRGAAFLQPSYSMNDELGRWNQTCIVCHATFGRMRPAERIDPDTGESFFDVNTMDSHVAEFGISCEACHGPGYTHAERNRNPVLRYRQHLTDDHDSTITNPANLSPRLQSQVCGQCHSVQCVDALGEWSRNGFHYRPGNDLEKSADRYVFRVRNDPSPRESQFLADHPDFIEDHFWSDGMVRISGREYNGLIESACHVQGELSCLSCHKMHQDAADPRAVSEWTDDQLDVGMRENNACLQCHEELGDEQRLSEHTHHDVTSSGSVCYNCHMSYTTYGLLKAIRSHQIDIPSATVSQQTGRPNACNQCHLDQTLEWTSQYLSAWYGAAPAILSEDERAIAASILWLLRGDAGQRALMAWSYGWNDAQLASGTDWMAPYLAQLLEDPYAAVRFIADQSLRTLPGFEQLSFDFVGSSEARTIARSAALQIWNRAESKRDRRVLVDDQGQLMQATFQRLLEARDNRPIVLVE